MADVLHNPGIAIGTDGGEPLGQGSHYLKLRIATR